VVFAKSAGVKHKVQSLLPIFLRHTGIFEMDFLWPILLFAVCGHAAITEDHAQIAKRGVFFNLSGELRKKHPVQFLMSAGVTGDMTADETYKAWSDLEEKHHWGENGRIVLPSLPGILLLMSYHKLLMDNIRIAESDLSLAKKKSFFAGDVVRLDASTVEEFFKYGSSFHVLPHPVVCSNDDNDNIYIVQNPHDDILDVPKDPRSFVTKYGFECYPQFDSDFDHKTGIVNIMVGEVFGAEVHMPMGPIERKFSGPVMHAPRQFVDEEFMNKRGMLAAWRVWALNCLFNEYRRIFQNSARGLPNKCLHQVVIPKGMRYRYLEEMRRSVAVAAKNYHGRTTNRIQEQPRMHYSSDVDNQRQQHRRRSEDFVDLTQDFKDLHHAPRDVHHDVFIPTFLSGDRQQEELSECRLEQ